jgi:hypothetical protein
MAIVHSCCWDAAHYIRSTGLGPPDRALRVAAENSLNHFDLAIPDLEHVHIGQPTVEVHETGCNSGFDIGNRERRCVRVGIRREP